MGKTADAQLEKVDDAHNYGNTELARQLFRRPQKAHQIMDALLNPAMESMLLLMIRF